MNKIIKMLAVIVILFGLTGCGVTEKPIVKLCNELDKTVSSYNSKKLDFKGFAKEVSSKSSSFCKENKKDSICIEIKVIKNQSNYNYEEEDCSTKPSDFKEICESANKAKKEILKNRKIMEDSYVKSLEHSCKIAREKKNKNKK